MLSFLNSKVLEYTPPRLVKNSLGWSIQYYYLNPATEKLERKVFRLNALYKQCTSITDFKQKAYQIMNDLMKELDAGWKPIGRQPTREIQRTLFEVLDYFLETKSKELRKDTIRTYTGVIQILKRWVGKSPLRCNDFTHKVALNFMNYLYTEHDIGARTYNNYLKVCRVIFTWMTDNLYIEENPFANIKRKKVGYKQRVTIPISDRRKILDWCNEHSPYFALVCKLVYFSLVRPMELTKIQVKHIDLVNKCIFLPGSITKNGKDRIVCLSDDMVEDIAKLTARVPKSYFLFGLKFKPAKKALARKRYILYWERMRDDLHFDESYQMYSLRDTGICDKLNAGMSPIDVMKAADHSSLEITTTYVTHIDDTFLDKVSKKSPTFV